MKPANRYRRCESLNRPGTPAFTLVELLVVLAVLAFGTLLLAPALAHTQFDSRSVRCLNNHRQLTRAWQMYADDSNDKFPGMAFSQSTGAPDDPRKPWVSGWLDWSISSFNTNTLYLTHPRFSSLALYFGNDSRLVKCTADQFLSSVQRAAGWKQRIRSVSGNVYLGGASSIDFGPFDPNFSQLTKRTELLNPKPAETWLFIEENADSINDPAFYAPKSGTWYDMPANYHDGGAAISFADGRAEIHRWEASVLPRTVTTSPSVPSLIVPANDPDYLWLRYHTPRKPGAN